MDLIMQVVGTILLICMVMLFGISALAAAFEASENKRKDKEKETEKRWEKHE